MKFFNNVLIASSTALLTIIGSFVSMSSAQAAAFNYIRIGDKDGFGFGTGKDQEGELYKGAYGGYANKDGKGLLGVDDVLPDLNRKENDGISDGILSTGSNDNFDHRSSQEKDNESINGNGFTNNGSSGSKFTDISLSVSHRKDESKQDEEHSVKKMYDKQYNDYLDDLYEKTKDELTTEIGTLTTEIGTLETAKNTLVTEIGTLETAKNTLDTEISTLTTEIEELRADRKEEDKTKEEKKSIQDQIDLKKQERNTKQQERNTKKDEIKAKNKEFNTKISEIEAKGDEIKVYENVLTIKQLEVKKDNLIASKKGKTQTQKESIRTQVNDKRSEIRAKERENKDLKPFKIPQATFDFNFSVNENDIAQQDKMYFNLLFGDYDVKNAEVEFTTADGSTFTEKLQKQENKKGEDGLIQSAFVELDFDQIFTKDGDNYNGELTAKIIAQGEPYLAYDFAELSTRQISLAAEDVPEPTTIIGLMAFGGFGASSLLKRKQQQRA